MHPCGSSDPPLPGPFVSAQVIAFLALVGGEVEHHPEKCSPQPRLLLHRAVSSLVEDPLPFFGMPSAAGRRMRGRINLMLLHACASAVFTDRKGALRKISV